MGDSLSIIFATIVAAIIMFLFPMLDTWERQDDLSYMAAYTAVVDTVDSVRNTGRLTEEMYNDLVSTLTATGNRFDISLEHRQYVMAPVGTPNADGTYNDYEMVYVNHYTDEILSHLTDPSKDNEYKEFNTYDYFYISVKNTNVTQATVLKQNLYGTKMETFKIGVPYGGQIKNEYK